MSVPEDVELWEDVETVVVVIVVTDGEPDTVDVDVDVTVETCDVLAA